MHLPFWPQEKDYACGPACVRMVLAHYGTQVTEKELRRLMGTGPIFGTRHRRFIPVLARYGLHARATTNATLEHARRALSNGHPVIVNYTNVKDGTSHYAALTEIAHGEVVLNDPWHGFGYRLPLRVFEERWNSRNRFGKGNWYSAWMLEVADAPL